MDFNRTMKNDIKKNAADLWDTKVLKVKETAESQRNDRKEMIELKLQRGRKGESKFTKAIGRFSN